MKMKSMRLSIFLAILVIGSGFAHVAVALESQPFFKDSFLNLKDDLSEATKKNRILVLFFEQDGCPYCVETHKVVFADKRIVDSIKAKFDMVSLDIWGNREVTDFSGQSMSEKEFSRKMGVQFTPMINFIGPDGKELYRIAGYYPPQRFKAALEYVAQGHYRTTSFREYADRVIKETGNNGLLSADFFAPADDLQKRAAIARKNGKGLAIVFEQAQCEACVEMHQKSFADPKFVKLLSDKFDTVRIDTRGKRAVKDMTGKPQTEAQLAGVMGVRYTPSVLFFDANGKEIMRHESYLRPEHFATLVAFLTNGTYLQYKSFQDWLRVKNAPGAS